MKPTSRFAIFVTLILISALAVLVFPTFAGGWAVVTLDRLPDQVVAGESISVGFVVRQHGVSPLGGLRPTVTLQKEGDMLSTVIDASQQGQEGHYTAALTFPSAGVWNWSVQSDFYPETQPMPALTVVTRAAAVPVKAPAASPWPFAVGVAGLIGVVGGGLALARTKAPWAAAVTIVAALVGVVGFASATTQARAVAPAMAAVPVPPAAPAEIGQRLFVAKGCVVCHTHESVADVKKVIGFSMDDVPNLTNYSANADYLAKWLDDPQATKPNTSMPRLDLSDDEIGALVAFINTP
jgi:cytochrome c551/c552